MMRRLPRSIPSTYLRAMSEVDLRVIGGHRAGGGKRHGNTRAFQLFSQALRECVDVGFRSGIDGLVGRGGKSCHTTDVENVGGCVSFQITQ